MTLMQKIDKIMHKELYFRGHKADIYAILANFSTISNLLLGFVVLITILSVKHTPVDKLLMARLIVLAGSFDAIDGKFARRSNTRPKLGAQFDTAADLVSFGFAPSAMILYMFYVFDSFTALLFAGIYLFTASFRLSRFMIDPTTSKLGYFKGMPSPVSALFIAGWFVQPNIYLPLAGFLIVLISSTMISSLPYTALRVVKTKFQIFYAIFTVSIMLLFTYAPNSWMVTLGIIWIAYVTYFATIGPFHAYSTLVKEGHY
jgi:CDP-diacylglycerol--serine O-phosphatidyltransferase